LPPLRPDGVRTFEYRSRHVGDFGTGRDGRRDHRFQHLRRDDHRLAGLAARPRHPLLQPRYLFQRHFHAKVAPRHHQGVRLLEDDIQMLHRRRFFHLGHDGDAAARQLARLRHVVTALHERQADPIGAEIDRLLEIAPILVGHGTERKHGVGQTHPLAAGKRPADDHLRGNCTCFRFLNAHA
jgi:hypothetical protein